MCKPNSDSFLQRYVYLYDQSSRKRFDLWRSDMQETDIQEIVLNQPTILK